MKAPSFHAIERLPLLKELRATWRSATGLTLRLIPGLDGVEAPHLPCEQNPFCDLVKATKGGHEACRKVSFAMRQQAVLKSAPHQVRCFANLREVAVPVVVRSQHVAILLSGQVLTAPPSEKRFHEMLKILKHWECSCGEAEMRRIYFATPVVPLVRFDALANLLSIFARQLADHISQTLVTPQVSDPPAVRRAKAYIQGHFLDELTVAEVARQAGLSPFHFCRLFKKSTGLTLTGYITQVRLQEAKNLLLDPFARVSEVALAAGFGSIPQFNSVFRKNTGMSPTAYRKSFHQEFKV